MDSFTYSDIFDTKGIEYLIIIGFLLLIIPFWIFLSKPLKVRRKIIKSLGVLKFNILKIPRGLFYCKNHTWSHLEKSGDARIGIDDLLVHLTGQVEVSNLRNPGERINKGDMLAELSQGGKKLLITSPISGEVKDVNRSLKKNSENLSTDPYGTGWICKLKPDKWVEETSSYYLADESINWIRREIERFKDFIAVSVQKHHPETSMVVLQEGGELTDNPLSEMPDNIWHDFQESFLDLDS